MTSGWKRPNEPVRALRRRRPAGVADALGKVDCLASEATAVSFGRLFGAHGSFQTALTIILTLYVALLAFNLLTGRSALEISVADAADDDARPRADLRDLMGRLSNGGVEPCHGCAR